jgi:hypothetical protein
MAEYDVFKEGWSQQHLFSPTVVEATLRIGVITSEGHGQVQLELHDPISKVLFGLVSWPHCDVKDVARVATAALEQLLHRLEQDGTLPIPFPDGGAPG